MGRKKYIIYLLVLGMLITCFPRMAVAFSDTRQHWARPQIDHLQSRDLTRGYPDGTYQPEAYINREEFVALLIRILNKEEEARQVARGDSFFSDVYDTNWAQGYIEVARELNIVSGDGHGNFQPRKWVSREEAITMLVNSLGTIPAGMASAAYTDGEQISPWALDAVNYAAERRLVKGYPDGTFRPEQNLTRAEVAVLLEEYLNLKGQKFHFYGTLESIDLPLRQAVFTINGKRETFELAKNIVAYKEGSLQPAAELSLPANAYFDLDKSGDLSYLYLKEQQPAQNGIKVNFTRLSNSTGQSRGTNDTTWLSEDKEDLPVREASGGEIANSLAVTGAAMHADEFVRLTGATGRGQLVAVIDSGIDPGHPDLQKTSEGFAKLVDFIDLSDEGRVDLSRTVKATDDYIRIEGKIIDVRGIPNTGEFAYGYLSTSFFPAECRASLPGSRILVLAAASTYFDQYDTFYIDTDMDGEILDETPVRKYSDNNEVISIPCQGEKALNLVVSSFSADEKYVKFGFDCLGHGTEVAGIIAACGEIKGIAPGAQLLAVKVMNGSGKTSLDSLKEAVKIAAQRGAAIAVISMGQYQISTEEQQNLAVMAKKLWDQYGMILCLAAGNNGPGLGSTASTAAAPYTISVGAYATPEMWYNDYGWKVEKPTIWYFSSVGPAADGNTVPMVIAPGSVISTYPLWGDSKYRLDEGTSMAAPHVAGAAALLFDAVQHSLYRADNHAIYQALVYGAEPLPDFEPAEQGFGTVNLMRAWEEIKNTHSDPGTLQVKQYSPEYGYGKGFYSRELKPGELSLEISNNSENNKEMVIGGLASWINPGQYTVQIPAQSKRKIDISYDEPSKPGLYSNFLVGDDYSTPGWDIAALQTFIVPYYLNNIPGKQFKEENSLAAGQYKRYFFDVPAGTGKFDLYLDVGEGRARMHIISPEGRQDVSQYAGQGKVQVSRTATMSYTEPAAGTWEVVVYSSATLSALGSGESRYTFKAAINEVKTVREQLPDGKYLVSILPKKLDANRQNYISLYFWNPISKLPAQGAVAINGKVYEIKNGIVELDVTPQDDSLTLKIAW